MSREQQIDQIVRRVYAELAHGVPNARRAAKRLMSVDLRRAQDTDAVIQDIKRGWRDTFG